jgi:hypothetical protein
VLWHPAWMILHRAMQAHPNAKPDLNSDFRKA